MKQLDMTTTGIKIFGVLILLGLLGWYTVHVWSDCLEENSILTCMRVLSK